VLQSMRFFVSFQALRCLKLLAAVDWNLRITPTRRNQVVIPQPYVYIRSLRFNICRYEQLSDGCLILPVWVPMLEAAYW